MNGTMRKTISMKEIAASHSEAFKAAGFDAPALQGYYRGIHEQLEQRATRVVNGMLKDLLNRYVAKARPFLVADLMANLYDSIAIEFDEQGPFIRLNTTPKAPEPAKPCGP